MQSSALLDLNKISEYKISVTPHRTLNNCQGVISEDDLLESSEDEILEGLSGQGVVAVRRSPYAEMDSKDQRNTWSLPSPLLCCPRASRQAISTVRFAPMCQTPGAASSANDLAMALPPAVGRQHAQNAVPRTIPLTTVSLVY